MFLSFSLAGLVPHATKGRISAVNNVLCLKYFSLSDIKIFFTLRDIEILFLLAAHGILLQKSLDKREL